MEKPPVRTTSRKRNVAIPQGGKASDIETETTGHDITGLKLTGQLLKEYQTICRLRTQCEMLHRLISGIERDTPQVRSKTIGRPLRRAKDAIAAAEHDLTEHERTFFVRLCVNYPAVKGKRIRITAEHHLAIIGESVDNPEGASF